jgi:cytochrome c553
VVKRLAAAAVVVVASVLGAVAACAPSSGKSDGGDGITCPPLDNDTPDACPSWSGQVEGLVATYCLRCHGEGGVEVSAFDFSTYAKVHAQFTAMITQVNECSMPPWDASPPAAQPTPAERQAMLSWLSCSAPNN